MLLLLLLWALFGGLCFLSGHAILVALRLDSGFPRAYDRALVALWLGMVSVALLFLAISIFFPLKPLVAAIVFGGTSCLSLGHKANVRAVRSCLEEITLPAAAGTMFIAVGTAAYASQFITLTDSGLYHIQMIRWLAEYGTVPGLALLHDRLGFTSSWFALSAPLGHGAVQGHAYSFAGGFVLFTMIHALGVSLSRIAGNAAQREDVFLAVAFSLSIPPVLFWRMGVSPSPDLPVIVLAIIIAWIFLKSEMGRTDHGVSDFSLIPLLLSLGAVTIKLSAAPLALVTGAFFLMAGEAKLRRLVTGGGLAVLVLGPYLVINTMTSGYPLFPSALIMFDLPWTLPAGAVSNLENLIKEWARWGGRPTPEWGNNWNWILPWIKDHVYYASGIIVSLASCAVVLLRNSRLTKSSPDEPARVAWSNLAVMAVAMAGLAFSVFSAPDLRFGLGYMVIMPAVLATILFDGAAIDLPRSLGKFINLQNFSVATLLGVFLHIWCIPLPAYANLTAAVLEGKLQTEGSPYVNWILPPAVLKFYWKVPAQEGIAYSCEKLDYVLDCINGMVYSRPAPENASKCWDAPLPCAPDKIQNIKMLKPRLGLTVAFSWQDAD